MANGYSCCRIRISCGRISCGCLVLIPRFNFYDFGDPRLFPPGLRIGWADVDVSARIQFQIKCTEYHETAFQCTNDEPRVWYITGAETHSLTIHVPYRFSIGPWYMKAAAIAAKAIDMARNEFARLAYKLYGDPTLICIFGI